MCPAGTNIPAPPFPLVLSGEGITGAKMEKACDEAHITLNKNAVVGDSSAMNPGGVRIGEWQAGCVRLVWPQGTLHHAQLCACPMLIVRKHDAYIS